MGKSTSSAACLAFAVLTTVLRTASADSPTRADLRDELARRVAADQAARKTLIERSQAEGGDAGEVQRLDAKNTAWLKAVVVEVGWPGRSLVGRDGAHNAWLLVQHADEDRKFQKDCLRLMRAMPDGEVSDADVAYLADRLLVADGKPQRYGTQLRTVGGKRTPGPVEEPDRLDERRASVGLPPMAEYLKLVDEVYGRP